MFSDNIAAFNNVSILHDIVLKTIDADKSDAPPMAIVGNKVDLEEEGQRKVSTEDGKKLAERLSTFTQCSAL